MKPTLCTNFNWREAEGQHLLRMKRELYQQYLDGKFQDDSKVDEKFLNFAILCAYRIGRAEGYQNERDITSDICLQLIRELEVIKERGYV